MLHVLFRITLTFEQLGTLLIPRVTSASAIYTLLLVLVSTHLILNYFGIRGIALRTLNRQRATLLWQSFVASDFKTVPSPQAISHSEELFYRHSYHAQFALDGLPLHQTIIVEDEKFLVCSDKSIVLKEGHCPVDHLKAWVYAFNGPTDHFQAFVAALEEMGWIIGEGGLLTMLPRRVICSAENGKED